jgi:hypothetical protein
MLTEVHPLSVCNTTLGFEFRGASGGEEPVVEVALVK